MAKIKGVTVTLTKKTANGFDDFGAPKWTISTTTVDNVLIAPTSNDDYTTQLNLTGKKAVYTLAIPKGDTNNWEDTEVEFFGKKWRTFGFTTHGIESLIPLDWNKKVMVEAYG